MNINYYKKLKKFLFCSTQKKIANNKCGLVCGPAGQPTGRGRSEKWTQY